jgi:hypothetical protein
MCFLNNKVHLLVSELYIYQNARCNNNKEQANKLPLRTGTELCILWTDTQLTLQLILKS